MALMLLGSLFLQGAFLKNPRFFSILSIAVDRKIL